MNHGNFAGEVIVGEDEAANTRDAGDAGGKISGEAVVREVEVLEVGPRGEVEGGGKAVVVEAEKPEASEAS